MGRYGYVGDWPLPDADHFSLWSKEIMTHIATFHKKGDMKLLTVDLLSS